MKRGDQASDAGELVVGVTWSDSGQELEHLTALGIKADDAWRSRESQSLQMEEECVDRGRPVSRRPADSPSDPHHSRQSAAQIFNRRGIFARAHPPTITAPVRN
jgi:hypothetical protein